MSSLSDSGWDVDPIQDQSANQDEGWDTVPEGGEQPAQQETQGSGRMACQDDEFLREVDDIVFSNNPVAIITAKPGTGKSTILPIYLTVQYEGHVVVSEPRVVAVDKLYARAMELRHSGRADFEVLRCTRRNDDVKGACRRGAKPRLIFATDGKIVNRSLHSAIFGVFEDQRCVFKSFLVIDEIHEMNLNMEICLSKARDYISTLYSVGQGHEFQLFIISATIQQIGELYRSIIDFFSAYGIKPYFREVPYEPPFTNHIEFSSAKMTIAGRDKNDDFSICYRVERKVDEIRKSHPDAGILIFVSSMIVAEALKGRLVHLYKHRTDRYPVHIVFRATVTPVRDEAFGRGVGKTIICSNIAEPSLTIEDIDFVIDTGTVRRSRNFYELDTLYEESISQAEAIHRAGRVGRVSTGKVFRLYTEEEFDNFPVDPPSQSSREDARLVAAYFCSKMEISPVSEAILQEKMVTKHEGMTRDTLNELAAIGLLTPDDHGRYETNVEMMHTFARQCSTFAGSYVGMMLSTFNSEYYEPYVAAQALLNAPNFWLSPPSTEMYPENERPQSSAKTVFNDGFSEMTTMLKVYHRYISSDNEKEFCQQYGIFRDAIFDAELQFSSVIGEGKSMRMCANLERAYRNREQFREAICRHMFCAKLDTVSQKYKIQNVPHFADVKETDAVYVNPKDEARRRMKILCDGLISTVPGKNYLVNTMLCPDDSIEDANPPSTTHGSVGQAPLADGLAPVDTGPRNDARDMNPDWY